MSIHEILVCHRDRLRGSNIFNLLYQGLHGLAARLSAGLLDDEIESLILDNDLAVTLKVTAIKKGVDLRRHEVEVSQELKPNALQAIRVLLKESEVLPDVRNHFLVQLESSLVGVLSSWVSYVDVRHPVLAREAALFRNPGVDSIRQTKVFLLDKLFGFRVGVEELFFPEEIFRVFVKALFHRSHNRRYLGAEQLLEVGRGEGLAAVAERNQNRCKVVLESLLLLRIVNMNEHVTELLGQLLAAGAELLELSVS